MTATVCEQTEYWDWRILNDIEIALRISGIAVVSSTAIPETVSLSSLQIQVSHNTTIKYPNYATVYSLYVTIITPAGLAVDTELNIFHHTLI